MPALTSDRSASPLARGAMLDTSLADALMQHSKLLAEDEQAHAREHSLEVQLPFLQQLLGDFTFVPICLGANRYDYCQEIGNAIATVDAQASGVKNP